METVPFASALATFLDVIEAHAKETPPRSVIAKLMAMKAQQVSQATGRLKRQKHFTTTGTTWRVFPPSPDYSVSDHGEVVRTAPDRQNKFANTLKKPYVCKKHYSAYTLAMPDGSYQRWPIGRIILYAYVGPPPSPHHQAAHNDGNPANNTVGNFRWATPSENNADKLIHGTWQRGSRIGNSVLTEADIPEIDRMIAAGMSKTAVATRFGVTSAMIGYISRRTWWKHIPKTV